MCCGAECVVQAYAAVYEVITKQLLTGNNFHELVVGLKVFIRTHVPPLHSLTDNALLFGV